MNLPFAPRPPNAFQRLGEILNAKADQDLISTLPAAARTGMITAPYRRPIQDHFGDMANLLDFIPARTGLAVDVIASMHAIRQDSPFRPFFAPPAQYRCNSPLPVITGPPLSMYGVGGNGDGPADYDYQNAVLFLLEYAQGDAFPAVTNYPCHFEGFRIETDVQFRDGYQGNVVNSGAAISVSGDTGNNAGTTIRRVGFAEKDIPIRLHKALLGEITLCHMLGWKTAGILSTTDSTREGGAGFIHTNRMLGASGTLAQQAARGPCVYLTHGYTWVYCNNFSGGQYGIYLAVKDRPAGAPRFFRNTIEDFWIAGVYAGTQDGTFCSMLDVEDNEFSLVDDRPGLIGTIYLNEYTAPWLFGFSVSRNRIRNGQGTRNGIPMIAIRGGVGGKANDNRLQHSQATVQAGISIRGANGHAALGGPIEAFDNQYYAEDGGSFSSRVDTVNALARVRDHQGLTAAQLGAAYPNALANGSEVWVNDGAPTSSPVTGGGPGTMARFIGGRWRGGSEAA